LDQAITYAGSYDEGDDTLTNIAGTRSRGGQLYCRCIACTLDVSRYPRIYLIPRSTTMCDVSGLRHGLLALVHLPNPSCCNLASALLSPRLHTRGAATNHTTSGSHLRRIPSPSDRNTLLIRKRDHISSVRIPAYQPGCCNYHSHHLRFHAHSIDTYLHGVMAILGAQSGQPPFVRSPYPGIFERGRFQETRRFRFVLCAFDDVDNGTGVMPQMLDLEAC
jgi:hypothetical protein